MRPPRCLLAAVVVAAALTSCTGDGADRAASSPTPTVSTSPSSAPDRVGPTPRTVFSIIRELGVRPGSLDEFMIRDLLAVAETLNAHLLATGRVASLDEARRTKDYRLRGGSTVELVSGVGSTDRFCLRAHLRDQDPRQWFFDTSRVLPRGESCA